MIDLHGAKKERDFDVEIGTINGKTASEKTVSTLIDCLNKNGIKSIILNDPFKGGDITRTIFDKTGIECIQLEINNMRKICKSLIMFVGH